MQLDDQSPRRDRSSGRRTWRCVRPPGEVALGEEAATCASAPATWAAGCGLRERRFFRPEAPAPSPAVMPSAPGVAAAAQAAAALAACAAACASAIITSPAFAAFAALSAAVSAASAATAATAAADCAASEGAAASAAASNGEELLPGVRSAAKISRELRPGCEVLPGLYQVVGLPTTGCGGRGGGERGRFA